MFESATKSNIHTLSLGTANSSLVDVQGRYAALQKSPLFDLRNELWEREMCSEGKVNQICYYASDQLLSIVVEAYFDHENAAGRYHKLSDALIMLETEQSPFWINEFYEDYNTANHDFPLSLTAELTGVWVQSLFDRKAAFERFQALEQKFLKDGFWRVSDDSITACRRG